MVTSQRISPAYKNLTPEQQVVLAKTDLRLREELYKRCKKLVEIIAKDYFLPSAEHIDLIQEGTFGLLKGINSFDPRRCGSVRYHLSLSIKRMMITAVKRDTRNKHQLLNSRVSPEDTNLEESVQGRYEAPEETNPEEALLIKEEIQRLYRELSPFEYQVFIQYQQRYTYSEIASSLDCKKKPVDNALRRAKRKAKELDISLIQH